MNKDVKNLLIELEIKLATDALISNLESHAMHKALGFEETERVVFFKRTISE